MIVTVVPSIHRPWRDQGGYYSCPPLPSTTFTELSPTTQVRQVRDGRGRWRSVRGVHQSGSEAILGPAYAVRCREPHGLEGVLIYGGPLGVLMMGVGDPGIGSPMLWVEDIRDVPGAIARVLRTDKDEAQT